MPELGPYISFVHKLEMASPLEYLPPYTIAVPTKDVLNITFMIPPLLLIVISCASVKDLCRSMCHKSIYLCLLGVFTAEDCAFRYAKKLSIQSR